MFRNVLIETASTRAHSAIINAIEAEVIARRDTSATVRDRANLRMFMIARNAFLKSWNKLVPHIDPFTYAMAWDSKFNKAVRKGRVIAEVDKMIRMILSDVAVDIESLMPIENFEDIMGAETALSEIMSIEAHGNVDILV